MDVKGLERLRTGLRRNLKVMKRNPLADSGRLEELEIKIANVGSMIDEARNA